MANGMPFFGKTNNSEYGDFHGIKDVPMKKFNNKQKARYTILM